MDHSEPDRRDEAFSREVRELWERKAAFWDERFGEGNWFHRTLVQPAVERLIDVRPGQVALDIACGNGAFSRRLAELGAEVVAFDFSEIFVERARTRTTARADRITYHTIDATSEEQLLSLGLERYDVAVANMALMDMPDIAPLASTLPRLLKPSGCFIFAVPHPCFNSLGASQMAEAVEREGRIEIVQSVKVSRYLDEPASKGAGMPGEPNPHYYFHRPLHELFGSFFRAGFVLDGLEEPASEGEGEMLSWTGLNQIPPVLAARMRLAPPVSAP